MSICEAKENEKAVWNNFVARSPAGSFLQSWEWGDLQKSLGVPCRRFKVEHEGKMTGAVLAIQRWLRFDLNWWYLPGGPVGVVWLEDIKRLLGQDKKTVFVKIEPRAEASEDLKKMLTEEGWKKTATEVQPKNTLVVDLKKSEEELLAAMHSKARYNIRLAEKKGVRVRFSTAAADVRAFGRMADEMSARTAFHYHPLAYYLAQAEVLGRAGLLEMAIAEWEGKPAAIHWLMTFGGATTYVHGASSDEHREVMAPHLLHWEAMKRAKAKGSQAYDFYGVAPKDAGSEHAWAGITRFKEGFGGKRVEYAGGYDYVKQPLLYELYNMMRRITK